MQLTKNGLIQKSDFTDLVSAFADAKSVNDILIKLQAENLIEEQDEKGVLTAKGKELHLT